MIIYKIQTTQIPQIQYFNSISIDNFTHFKRLASEYILFFIEEGELYISEDKINYHLTQGDFVLLEKGKVHFGNKCSSHCKYFYIHFNMDILKHSGEYIPDLSENKKFKLNGSTNNSTLYIPKVYHTIKQGCFNQFLSILNSGRYHFNSFKEYSHLHSACILTELLIYLSYSFKNSLTYCPDESNKRSIFVVNQLIKEINYNYTNKLSSLSIEEKFSCNYNYINRLFKQKTGYTIGCYLTYVRIMHAKSLIISGTIPIKTIAAMVGYQDIYYFSNVFKKETGYSPTEFRKIQLKI